MSWHTLLLLKDIFKFGAVWLLFCTWIPTWYRIVSQDRACWWKLGWPQLANLWCGKSSDCLSLLQQGVWPEETPDSTVSVCWQYKFQEGFHDGLLLCILAACRNYKLNKTVLADWQGGVVARIGDVDIRILSNDHVFDLSARCKITNGNKQALNMAWATLAHFLYVTESYLSNFPGLHYQVSFSFHPRFISSFVTHSGHLCISGCGCGRNIGQSPCLRDCTTALSVWAS